MTDLIGLCLGMTRIVSSRRMTTCSDCRTILNPARSNARMSRWWLTPGTLGNVAVYMYSNRFTLKGDFGDHVEIEFYGLLDIL